MPARPPLVFITGASSGIGQALALRYWQAGHALALVARRGELLQAWCDAQGMAADRCQVYAADVGDVDGLIATAQACIARQGVPDMVIANAGISIGMDSAVRRDLDVMARIFATNNIGLAATFHPFIDAMRQRGHGRLVGVASVAGIRGLPGSGAYCASKAAALSYCESLRVELRGSGVRVVTIAPGFVDTPMTRSNRYPMPFLMRPEDFADRAFRAIEAGDSYRVIPWQMGWVAKLLRLLPNAGFDRLMAGRARKVREGE
ncbi:MAG: NADP-dependent 3-hydroxy acid dehydrogenase YdfG [Paracidovorax wautersii]|uniref:NADP-dependent 3-hydroxy acid dehydrogenase YdfG n=1 Tax=Paracidovorax wautersii TaxID=1177982 RepID=A0A7V8FLI4_9BURK|nr:MAG: NADP-dependent 3-hydroxy acid dehydrogenase YdfG [Paracidovorax wautersii]